MSDNEGTPIEQSSNDLDQHSLMNLTTVGRVTGQPHRIEIWFASHHSGLYLLSGGGDRSDWVRNIMHTPAVTVTIGESDYRGSARVVIDPSENRLARDTVFAKYSPSYGGDLTAWREASLPIAIDLDGTHPTPA